MRIVLLGPPGAGKGTQARRLCDRYGVPHVSTGDMMRSFISSGHEIGVKARRYVDTGRLVPDDVIIAMVRERLRAPDCAAGFLLDGFPRTVPQAQALDDLLAELGVGLDAVVELRVPADELLRRLERRARIEERRDDVGAVVEERLKVYEERTRPVSRYYERDGRLVVVEGVGGVEEVAERLAGAIEARKGDPDG